jgi:putrescine transport system substrate-binding protein
MRNAIGSAALLIVAMVLLVGCGNSERDETPGAPAAAKTATAEEKVLHVYNWADYIAEDTIRNFETRTGIKVTYDVFDSAEVLTTKLLTGGSGYDVVMPNGASTYRLGQSGSLLQLDRSQLKNLANLDPRIMQLVSANDPGNERAVPYLWGTTGLGYNPDLVEKSLGTRTLDSLGAVFDPAIAAKLAPCGITMLDSPSDMFQAAFVYLGLNPNSERPEDIAAAEALLTRARPFVRYFHSSKYVGDLASGEVCVSIGWSGAVQQARSRGAEAETPVEVVYVIPREGASVWFDMVAVPVDAPHPQNAHAFLDYLMEPAVIAAITNTVGQANGNAASLPFVTQALRDDATVYPSNEDFARLTVDKAFSAETLRTIGRSWARIQAGT